MTDAAVGAATLNFLDGKTTVTVDATAVGTLTGTAADIATAISAATIDTAADVAATVDNGQASITQANTIAGLTTGVVTATVTSNSLTNLLNGLTVTNNSDVLGLTVTDGGTVSASHLHSLDAKTAGQITDTAITGLSGTAAEVLTVTNSIAASGLNKFSLGTMRGDLSDIATTISGSSANAADLLAIDSAITGHITASGLTSLSGSSINLQTIADNLSSIGLDKFTIGTLVGTVSNVEMQVTDLALSAAVLTDITAHTTGNVDIASNATIRGTVGELTNLFAYSNIHPNTVGGFADLNVTIGAVPYLDTNTQGLLDYLAQYTHGNIRMVGTSSGQTFDFSSYTGHAPTSLSLDAGAGNDTILADADFDMTLTGGLGKDVFAFTLSGADTPLDIITDFGTGGLNDSIFNNGLISTLNGDVIKFSLANLVANLSAGSANDLVSAAPTGSRVSTIKSTAVSSEFTNAGHAEFVYDSTTGALYFDPVGNGTNTAAIHVANIGTGLSTADMYKHIVIGA